MSLPRWTALLLRWVAPRERAEDLIGDLQEVHGERRRLRGVWIATALTSAEALEMAAALLIMRARGRTLGHRAGGTLHGGSGRGPLITWLDLKLGLRMLVKYPGLTLVGGLAMAFGIWVGAGGFEFYTQVVHPRIPLDEGDRIVGIRMVDAASGQNEPRILRDLATWRRDLSSLVELGAAVSVERNLVVGEARGEPLRGAEISASAFAMARVPPLLGRTFVAADERPGGPAVAVLGYDVWQTRLGADPDIVGRMVRIGDEPTTIVGVMPEGFAFPINQGLWLPLRVDGAGLEPRQGPAVLVFGRLARGRRLGQAQTELTALGRRAAGERPEAYEHLRPRVLPLAESILGVPRAVWLGLGSINILLVLLLVLVCGNVALLMFARAAAREGEIVVRTALGASRARVVGQLFAEALVLGAVAAVVGLGAAGFGLRWFFATILYEISDGTPPPFWAEPTLSPTTLVYAAGLTLLGAAIAGVVPGLKVTGGNVEGRLRRTTAGGGGLRLGGVWTAVIVVQIAVTVTLPVVAWFVRRDSQQVRAFDVGFASEEFLTARLRLPRVSSPGPEGDESPADYGARFGRTALALAERLQAEPSAIGVTFVGDVPGTYHPWRRIEMDAGGEAPRSRQDEEGPGRWVAGGRVAPNFFDVLGVDVLRGRGFVPEDAEPEARTVVVNQGFVDRVLGGRNPIGRHLRYLGSGNRWDGVSLGDPPGPWYRIVGVVPDLGMTEGASTIAGPGLYHALLPEDVRANRLLVHVNGDTRAFATRIRELAAAVEPTLGLEALQPLDRMKDTTLRFYSFWFWLTVGVSSVALLLSMAGIYAVMSFTVARRTREIGVRVALGARPWSITMAIFRRPLIQIATGIVAGAVLTGTLTKLAMEASFWGTPALLVLGYDVLMTAVCLLACVVPTRRALSIEPTDAMRVDG